MGAPDPKTNMRAIASWLGTPIVSVAVALLAYWFFSTKAGLFVGLIVGPMLFLGLILLIGLFFYVFRR
jgi:hypothetical protein